MPIAIACPSCKVRLQAPDTAAGKRVKCPKCQTAIPVPGGEAPAAPRSAPAPAKAPAKKSAPDNDFNFDDDDDRPAKKGAPARRPADDDDEDDRPAKKSSAVRKGRDDDYDDDDDRPAKKGAIKKGRDDDYDDEPPARKGKARDDYDDEDDDLPKSKKGKKGRPVGNFPTPTQEDMSNAFNMYLFAFIANLVVGGAGAIVFLAMWFMKRKESPLVDWHGKQVINTWISSILALFVLGGIGCAGGIGLGSISQDMAPVGAIVGFLFGGLAVVYAMYCGILFLIGMFKAKSGDYWRFPGVWHLLK